MQTKQQHNSKHVRSMTPKFKHEPTMHRLFPPDTWYHVVKQCDEHEVGGVVEAGVLEGRGKEPLPQHWVIWPMPTASVTSMCSALEVRWQPKLLRERCFLIDCVYEGSDAKEEITGLD
jgi:hypothetical protein